MDANFICNVSWNMEIHHVPFFLLCHVLWFRVLLACHLKGSVQVPDFLLLIQLPVNVPRRAVKDYLNAWAPVPT